VTQAVHIFEKDARRLWLQIAAVAVLFAAYAFLSPETALNNNGALLDWNGIPAALVVLACWTLGASAIHEDSPAEESPFWLTRPYDRVSLVAAKILFLFAFVFVPLLLAGVVLEMRAGASVFANAGALIGLCLVRSLWLILPALSLGVVTRGLLDFSGAVLLGWVLLLLTTDRGFGIGTFLYGPDGPGNPLRNASIASVAPMIVAGIVVLGMQLANRHTMRSRGYVAAGVLLSGLLASSDGVASFSRRVAHPGFDSQKIHLDFDRSKPIQADEQNESCADVPLQVGGLAENMVIRGTGIADETNAYFSTFRGAHVEIQETENQYRARICPVPFTPNHLTLHAPLTLEVIEVSAVATLPVNRSMLDAGGAGRCEIREDVTSYLRCTLTEPVSGVTIAGLEYPGYQNFARGFGDAGTFPLSPVLRQKFDGVSKDMPGGWPLDDALRRNDARLVLRNERIIGAFPRTLIYEGLNLPRERFRLRPKPVSPGPGMPKQ